MLDAHRLGRLRPGSSRDTQPQLNNFIDFCASRTERVFADYWAFDRFAVDEFHTFWALVLEWSGIPSDGRAEPVCEGDSCETARFFPGLTLNYAEAVLSAGSPHSPAILAHRANGPDERIERIELRRRVVSLACALRRLGIGPGDRVAAIVRNRQEAVVAMLATAAIGAAFSSCAPETGVPSILARFRPIAPRLLLAHVEPEPWDGDSPISERVAAVAAGLPSLECLIALDADRLAAPTDVPVLDYRALVQEPPSPDFRWVRFPFDHPLLILFSSGTTGPPKCIVHGAGGTLIEHLKEHRLHCDLTASDRLYFHTSCAWMMWNWQLSALASGAEIVLYDGPVREPDVLWRLVERLGVTVFGTSPAYLQLCEAASVSPGSDLDLSALRAVLSTGSILHDRQFDWIREHVKDVPVQSISGGTDIIGCFVLGNPLLPVHRGEAQCRSLGLDVRALPGADAGSGVGELVCANPFPSRPIGFLGDGDGSRFHEAYFAQNAPFWTHGDLIAFSPHGGVRLHGRSDGVLNIRGVRIGPAEIYGILRSIDEVVDALAVEQADVERPGSGRLILLVVLRPGSTLTPALVGTIRTRLASDGSAAHVPAQCLAVPELPTTFSGKRSEAAARDVVNGREVRNRGALSNPASLDAIRSVMDAATDAATSREHAAVPQRDGGDLREALCRIVSRRVGAQIGPEDDFRASGADSLTLVLLATDISEFVGAGSAGSAIFSARTVEELLRSIASGTEAGADGATDRPRVRPAVREDFDEICQLLKRGFRDDRIEWWRIFEYRWLDDKPDLGFVLTANGRIVGFLGTVYSRARANGGRAAWVCNLSSWFVEDAYRGWGSYLLSFGTRRTDTVYTSITPSRETRNMLAMLRYQRLDRQRFFLPLLNPRTFRLGRLRVERDHVRIRASLDDSDRKILDDHAACDLLHLLVSDGSGSAYLIVRRRWLGFGRWRNIPTSEVLYCNDPALLERNFERIKLAILWRQRSILFAAHEGHVPKRIRSAKRANGDRYMSVAAEALSHQHLLYSELVLLPV